MKKDIRYNRTESLILDSFIELANKKSIEFISVTDICNKAKISRNAFYAHYEDKYDFLNKITELVLSELKTKIRDIPKEYDFSEALEFTTKTILSYFSINEAIISVLIKNNPLFWDYMTDVLAKIILLYIGTNEKNLVYAKYSSSALCGCIKQFILKKIPISEEIFIKHITEIANETNRFIKEKLCIQ